MDTIKKNILDLNYARYLQNRTNAIIIIASYLISFSLAIITGQVQNVTELIVTVMMSVVFLTLTILYLFEANHHLKHIPRLIGELEPNTKI